MPRRTLLLSCLVAAASQFSTGCCCWRPFAGFWANGGCCAPAGGVAYSGGPTLGGGPAGCASCGSSPLAGAAPVYPAPEVGGYASAGYPIAATPGVPTGSVFTGPPTQFGSPPVVSKEVLPMPR